MKKSLLLLLLTVMPLTVTQTFAAGWTGCQYTGAVDPNNSPTSGTGTKKDQILFFDWAGKTMAVGQQTTIAASNGVTYTAEITRVNPGNSPLPLPHDMKTWVNPGSPLWPQQARAHLLYDNPALKPAFYPNVNATHNLDYDIKVSAVITGTTQTVPVDVIVVDAEATSPKPGGNPPKPPEVLNITTDGGGFKIFDTHGSGGVYSGLGTQTITYTDTQRPPYGTTFFYSENASTITFDIETQARQGAALGIYLKPCSNPVPGLSAEGMLLTMLSIVGAVIYLYTRRRKFA